MRSPEHLEQAIAFGYKCRPENKRNHRIIIEGMRLAAEERQRIEGKFLAYTAVEAYDSHREGEPITGRSIADIIIAAWDMEVADDRDFRGSAGI